MFFIAYAICPCPNCSDEVTLYVIEANNEKEAIKKWRAKDRGIRFFPDPTDVMQFFSLTEETFRRLPFVFEQDQN